MTDSSPGDSMKHEAFPSVRVVITRDHRPDPGDREVGELARVPDFLPPKHPRALGPRSHPPPGRHTHCTVSSFPNSTACKGLSSPLLYLALLLGATGLNRGLLFSTHAQKEENRAKTRLGVQRYKNIFFYIPRNFLPQCPKWGKNVPFHMFITASDLILHSFASSPTRTNTSRLMTSLYSETKGVLVNNAAIALPNEKLYNSLGPEIPERQVIF